jgi:eukaryotic-like serine/threonine-protein kinase
VATTRKRPSIKGWMVLLGMLVVLVGLLALLAQSLKNSTDETVSVPNVINTKIDIATSELLGLGLRVETKYETNTAVGRDVVFDQSPKPNIDVQSGSLITLKVSSGDGILRVPDVVGQNETVATSTLRNKGFSVKVEARADDATAPGNVIEQNPRADTEARAGDPITIVVASRSGTGKVPDVVGSTPEDASAALTTEGFRTVIQNESSATIAKGQVSRTEPKAGAQIDRNGTVIVFVSQGPAVLVPDLNGQNEASAIQTLKTLGFVVDRQTKFVVNKPDVGTVLEQSPAAGQAVYGSTVSITIGELDPQASTTVAADGGRVTVVSTTVTPTTTVPVTAAPTTLPVAPPTVPETTAVPVPVATPAPPPISIEPPTTLPPVQVVNP